MSAAALSVATAQMLVERRVDLRRQRFLLDDTPCHLAALRADDAALCRFLVHVAGVDVAAPDDQQRTCVHTCALHDRDRALRVFIDAGANLEAADDAGNTPLLTAASAGSHRCVAVLLAAGADLSARNARGETVYHLAAIDAPHDVHAIATLLIAAGASVDAADNDGRLPSWRAFVTPDAGTIERERRRIAQIRLDFVRSRALQVCVGLQPLGLDALQLCEVLLHACGPVAPQIPFHQWWRIATTVKHFRKEN